jgi:type I restriction enzyme, S subunit
MNANRLLSHFEKISDAPDAVDRLRRFILDLAVRGKLVEQDAREGTATDLLAQHRMVVEASGEMQPFLLPDCWVWVPVGVVCSKTGSGSTPRGGKAAYMSKGIPFLRSQNVHDDGLTLDDVAYIDAATHSKMIGTAVHPDDLLLNITGGSMGRCCHVPSSFKEGNVSQHVAILRVAIPGTQAFLHKCIISPFFQSLIFDEQTGAGRGGLPKNRMDRLPVPLPPLAEQHRIVEKVDEMMTLCDRLAASQKERESRRDRLVVASLNRLSQPTEPDEFKKDARFHLSNLNRLAAKPEHIKELRKAILNLAVRGELVPQDEKEGTAAECLTTLGLQPAEPPPDCENRDLPPSWCMVRFDDVAAVTGGVTLGRKLGGRKTASFPYLRVANVQRGGFDLSVIKEVDVPVEEVEKYALKANDLLMTEGGDWDKVGRSAIWRNQLPLCLHQNHVFCARMKSPEMSPVWFERYFNSPAGRAYFESCSKQTTNLASINMRQVRGCPVPLPPLAEQRRIVEKVDELMLICDQLENQLESQQKGRRQLLEALLHEALEGVG